MSDTSTPRLLFIDSGLGGLSYLECVRKERPDWDYHYLADTAYFPYGGRDSLTLISRLCDVTRAVSERYTPDLMVVACNTASVTALDALRKEFDFPIVGVVPAVKPATAYDGAIAVIATEQTANGNYLKSLIDQFAPCQDVETVAAPDLVDFVENRLFEAEEEEILDILKPYTDQVIRKEWTALVLGCTHYIFLKPWLRKMLPDSVALVDSTDGVTRRILDLLKHIPAENSGDRGNALFQVTGNGGERYRRRAEERSMNFLELEVLS